MGKVGDVLFGKPPKPGQSSSESGNLAWPAISAAMSPALGYVTGGGNMMGNLLGVGGGPAQTGALTNFANSGGMKFLQDEGMRGITSSKAASGLLRSGSYGTELAKYNQGLASTYLNQYLSHLNEYSRLGLGAGGLMTGAGSWSKGTGTTATEGKKGIAPDLLAAGATLAASDPRLKENVVEIGKTEDGLTLYEFDYKQDTVLNLPRGRFVGVMADEVPTEALGPTIKGYLTISDPKLFPKKVTI